MSWFEMLALAVALAMDAFAVSLLAGVTLQPLTARRVFRLSFHFGLFQALMPVIGWSGGLALQHYLEAFDHWVAFLILAFVGGRMIREAFDGDRTRRRKFDPTKGWSLVLLSLATSIDALAVGLSLGVIESGILKPAVVIGIVAACFTAAGMLLGRRIDPGAGRRVNVLGGLILIVIGLKILFEHLR